MDLKVPKHAREETAKSSFMLNVIFERNYFVDFWIDWGAFSLNPYPLLRSEGSRNKIKKKAIEEMVLLETHVE